MGPAVTAGHPRAPLRKIDIGVVAAILMSQVDEKVVSRGLRAVAELNGMDRDAGRHVADFFQLSRRELGVVAVSEKKNDVGPQADGELQSRLVIGAAVGGNRIEKRLNLPFVLLGGKHRRPARRRA